MQERVAPIALSAVMKALLGIALSAASVAFVVGYWLLACDGRLPIGARYCYPRRSHLVELLGCMALGPDEIAATRLRGRRLFSFPDIALQMEVSQARRDDLARRCGPFDGLNARGLGAEAIPLGQGRYAVTIRRHTGIRLH